MTNNEVKLDKGLKVNSNKMFKLCTVALVLLTLFTLTQAYYKFVLHLGLLILAFLFCGKAQKHTVVFIATGIIMALLYATMSLMKEHGLVMEHIVFFTHYTTWPFLFICVIHNFEPKEIKKLLYLVIGICIIGNILSLIQLDKNPEISRELAGAMEGAEKSYYYKKGVGGYGHVFAMTFFVFSVIRWLKVSTDKREKAFLILVLILNYLFILYASYTTAIAMVLVITGLSLIAGMKGGSRTVILLLAIVLVLVFANPIMEFAYDLAQELELDWVVKRLGQVMDAQSDSDMSALRRYKLYKESWDTFVSKPIFGGVPFEGDTYGGHSQILDTFAQYGLFAIPLLVFFGRCQSTCCRYIKDFKLTYFYIVFYVFATIDTCAAMQIPVVIYFVVPLIAYLESEGLLHENRDPNLSLGR